MFIIADLIALNMHVQLSYESSANISGLSIHLRFYFIYASNGGSYKTVSMGRLVWAISARTCNKYSKPRLKRPLKNRQNKVLKFDYRLTLNKSIAECSPYCLIRVKSIAKCSPLSLNAGQKNCRMLLLGAFCNTFDPH